MNIAFTQGPSGLTFAVRITPRAGRTAVAGVRGDALLIRLAAAPVDGAANDALTAFLAETFARPRRDVTIVSGHTSRAKRVAIAGLTESQFEARLNAILSA
ncbi:MAG: DUF167 domain-containing protein [Vicinamibacterales bacterium]